MTWRVAIEHTTGYKYRREVVSSYNEVRITPISNDRQLVLDAEVAVTPAVSAFRYWDYWGTLVHAFDLHTPHTELAVTGRSVVETSSPPDEPARSLGWSEVADPGVCDQFAELLTPPRHVPLGPDVVEAARPLAAEATPADACRAAVAWTRSRMRYEKGATTVGSSATDALGLGAGVCQDFAHVTLTLLRAMGIPARYVSGYLHPSADAERGTTVSGESHAWVEAWTGEWAAFDPTNGAVVGERHVVVGRARDYADLSPLQGIYHGGPAEALGVTVKLTRLA